MAQPCPEWVHTPMALTAMAPPGSGASSRTMLADLPPSSRNTFFTVSAPFGHDAPARGRRPREGDHVDSRVGGEDLAHQMVRGRHDVDDAGGDVGLLGDQPAEDGRRPRRVGSGLEHHGVARREGRAQLGEVQVEREVPRRDGSHHPHRLAPHQPALGLAEDVALGQPLLVFVADGLLDPVPQVVDGQVDLVGVGEGDGAAHLGHGHRPQLLDVRRRRPRAAARGTAGAARGPSTSRCRRRRGARRRWHCACPRRCHPLCRPGPARWLGRCWRSRPRSSPRRACRR